MSRLGQASIRGLLFDLDGTLYDLGKLKRRLLWRVPNELLRHGPLGAWRRFRALQRFRKEREGHRGNDQVDSLRDHLVEQVVARTGYTSRRVEQAILDFMYESDFVELKGLSPPGDRQVLAALAHRGYRLGVVSEYPVRRKLVALGLADLPWRAVADCEEVGTLKPQPEVFLEAGRRMGLAPPEILVVGDRRDADVTGAHAAGMYSAWLKLRDPGHGGGDSPDLVIQGLADLLTALPRRPRVASQRSRGRRGDIP